jgi:hypothetical protein
MVAIDRRSFETELLFVKGNPAASEPKKGMNTNDLLFVNLSEFGPEIVERLTTEMVEIDGRFLGLFQNPVIAILFEDLLDSGRVMNTISAFRNVRGRHRKCDVRHFCT